MFEVNALVRFYSTINFGFLFKRQDARRNVPPCEGKTRFFDGKCPIKFISNSILPHSLSDLSIVELSKWSVFSLLPQDSSSSPSRLKMNIIRNTGSSRSMAKVIRPVPTASPNFPPDLCVLSIGLENSFFIIFFLREQNSCYEGLFFVEGYIRPCILLKYERDTRDLHRNAKGGSFGAQPSRSRRLKSNRNVQKVYKIRK